MRNSKYKIPNTGYGQSLFEVVIAVGLAALILSGVVSLAAVSVRNSSFTRNNAQATKYAQEAMEWIRSQRDTNAWEDFDNNATGAPINICGFPIDWSTACPISGTIFSRTATLTLEGGDPDKIIAVVTVSWTDAQGVHDVNSQTRFTNWR